MMSSRGPCVPDAWEICLHECESLLEGLLIKGCFEHSQEGKEDERTNRLHFTVAKIRLALNWCGSVDLLVNN